VLVSVSPSRWRLIELRRSREAVRAGIDLLDRKREGLTRELVQRADDATRRRASVQASLARARAALERAFVDTGRFAAEAAALAQAPQASVEMRHNIVIGVRLPRIVATAVPFKVSYGPAGTSLSLDRAASRFAAVLPVVLDMAAEETALARLRHALSRTTRILNALEEVMLPDLDAEIAAVAAGLEEDERDERVRQLRATRRESWLEREGTTVRAPAS
jgi:V/A-type H+-transporting ATPase subunit D